MMKYIVKVRYIDFEFNDSEDAMQFAEVAKLAGREENEVEIRLVFEEEKEGEE